MSKLDPEKINVIVATDCGSTTTKAILIEKLDGHYRQTHRGEAPTTVEERATLDLRSWRVALCGAEPIRDGTLKRFAAAFEQSGFRREALFPAYGLAEATVIVSGGPSGTPPRVRTFLASAIERDLVVDAPDGQPGARRVVGCGSPLQPVVVVDPATRRRCASDQIGEASSTPDLPR